MREYSVAMPEPISDELLRHLVREDGQEDLCFALWTPSRGADRLTALVNTVLLPHEGDRNVHGNASFNVQYFDRVCRAALASKSGVAFLHSHPGPGWQGMSSDDIAAEQRMAGAVGGLTGLPLVGMTTGTDGTWSGRFWNHVGARSYRRDWAASVRTVGQAVRVDFADHVVARPRPREQIRRTVNVWSQGGHDTLARLRVGIVGLGSVGAAVAEMLARIGLQHLVLIDFDVVKPHNLDRLVTASGGDVGQLKVSVAADRIRLVSTAERVKVDEVPFSVVEKEGYAAALGCDVLFSCVDRPRPRHVLDHVAYAHLVPVIDGGILVRFRRGVFAGVDWQLQTVGPGRRCLQCLGAYDPGDVSTEAAGLLDDPSYMEGLAAGHRLKQSENVFPFAANLASLEVLHLVALVTGAGGIRDFGVQRYRYRPGILEQKRAPHCRPGCPRPGLVAHGDQHFTPTGRDVGAERVRLEAAVSSHCASAVSAGERDER